MKLGHSVKQVILTRENQDGTNKVWTSLSVHVDKGVERVRNSSLPNWLINGLKLSVTVGEEIKIVVYQKWRRRYSSALTRSELTCILGMSFGFQKFQRFQKRKSVWSFSNGKSEPKRWFWNGSIWRSFSLLLSNLLSSSRFIHCHDDLMRNWLVIGNMSQTNDKCFRAHPLRTYQESNSESPANLLK